MTKLDWHHIIHVVHFLGVALLFSQPVSSLIGWMMGPSSNLAVATKFAQLQSKMDRVTQAGIGILIVSGFGQIWAHDIGPGDIFTEQVWLGIKIVLVVMLILAGSLAAGPAIRNRLALLQAAGSSDTAEREVSLASSYRMTQYTGVLMMVIILAILAMVIFHPFTAHPR